MKKKKFPKKKAFAAALKKLKAEAQKHGRTLFEQISLYDSKKQIKAVLPRQPKLSIPPEIFQQLIFTVAGQSNRTPGQLLKSVILADKGEQFPKELQNWYSQIYGEFAKGSLSDVMRDVLLFAANRDDSLIPSIRTAILKGNIRYLEQIPRCVALVHGLRHENNPASLANLTRRNIALAYLRLYEMAQKPPAAREIHVLLARNACLKSVSTRLPKFSDIWYFLRSGPTDDSGDRPTRESRYELTGVRNIKKVMKSFGWPLGRSTDGPLNVTVVRTILDKTQLKYVDDSGTVTGN